MRRLIAKILTLGLAVAGFAGAACAQTYPAQQIRFIVPFAAGGGSDILARIISEPLAKRLGQPIVVENKPGAGATLGADLVAKSPPDGYTWLFTTAGPQITNPYLMPRLPYDPFRDFAPVAMLARSVNVLVVTPGLPVNSVRELIDYAKANPGKLNFSSSGDRRELAPRRRAVQAGRGRRHRARSLQRHRAVDHRPSLRQCAHGDRLRLDPAAAHPRRAPARARLRHPGPPTGDAGARTDRRHACRASTARRSTTSACRPAPRRRSSI